MMHGPEKSDHAIVAVKPANKVVPRCGVDRGGVSRSGVGGAKGGAACGKHLPFGPEVGAVCGKAARTVLCGGRAMKRTSLPLHGPAVGFGSKAAQNAALLSARTLKTT